MRKAVIVATMAALTVPATIATVTPAEAHKRHGRHYHQTDNGIRYWRGEDGRYHCRRSNGTTGLLIGGAAGALLGRAVDTRGDRATGTIVGAAAGALLGREVDRNRSEARCR